QGVDYERYPLIMLAIMESPAIVVGILLASWTRRRIAAANPGGSTARSDSGNGNGGSHLGDLLREAFTNGSVVLLLGSMLIGAIANPTAMKSLDPFTTDIFMGMLCLFLLEMGLEAGRRFGDFRRVGLALGAFGLVMPLIGGAIGVLVGHYMLGFSIGGTTLVGVLGASASYIAVPPAMRLAIPEANPSLYLTLSLGVTFPFNVVIGIPIYYQLARMLAGGA
ncbi:sodium-dependent bicarbonate transport family permease, partial [Thiocapsa sp. N5-Cardenillas]